MPKVHKDHLAKAPKGQKAKALGAYYTPDIAVQFMTHWAVTRHDKVIDPSFGNGQFLVAAHNYVKNPKKQLFGIEIDPKSYKNGSNSLASYQISQLWQGDFFKSEGYFEEHFKKSSPIEAFEVVLGNPPFIRYQRFTGETRALALQLAHNMGVKLPKTSSSWAPFLVHAVSLVKAEGRLAMIIPAELVYARYAKNVLEFLFEQFGMIQLLSFKKRLFPKLAEDTFVLLADKKGSKKSQFSVVNLDSVDCLKNYPTSSLESLGTVCTLNELERSSLLSKSSNVLEFILPSSLTKAYRLVKSINSVYMLGQICELRIGYVSGANNFFHVSENKIKELSLPKEYLSLAIRKGADLKAAQTSKQDLLANSNPSWLIKIPSTLTPSALPTNLESYLSKAPLKVRTAYKVKMRNPWYSVHLFKTGDAFLSCMSHQVAKLSLNPDKLVAANSVHVINFNDPYKEPLKQKLIVLSWYSSLTALSGELQGHSLGAGMLKLEPREAKQVRLALPKTLNETEIQSAFLKLDELLRQGKLEEALDLGDAFILQKGLGLSAEICQQLREAYQLLRDRRIKR